VNDYGLDSLVFIKMFRHQYCMMCYVQMVVNLNVYFEFNYRNGYMFRIRVINTYVYREVCVS